MSSTVPEWFRARLWARAPTGEDGEQIRVPDETVFGHVARAVTRPQVEDIRRAREPRIVIEFGCTLQQTNRCGKLATR